MSDNKLIERKREIDLLIVALVAASHNCIYYLNGKCWAKCQARDLCPQADLGEIVEDV